MDKIKSISKLREIRDELKTNINIHDSGSNGESIRLIVGMATCGIAAGARDTFNSLTKEVDAENIHNVVIIESGCMGLCYAEPTVEVRIPGKEPILYGNVTEKKAKEIVERHLLNGEFVQDIVIGKPLYKNQVRIALKNCGTINPENIHEYLAVDGYQALGMAIFQMTPEDVVKVVKDSGLRGRGGGGFLTGLKWEITRNAMGDSKYVICNADEGDPGAFMDRSILEGDPHSLVEAMAIAGYAMGSTLGYVYIRAEYPLAVKRLETAIEDARGAGLLGKNILGSDFSFDIKIRFGAGAFVCGEETALINSIEGKRGEPRNKPPFPSEAGLWNMPSSVNNVETFANIAQIILNGSKWFKEIGTDNSKGTKVFALAGKINNVGLVEVPMGTVLRDIIFDIGGGIRNNKKFKSVQTGGPSGGCIPEKYLDTPIDYDNLTSIGSMMGSGGMIVMDEDDCMVNVAKYYLEFTMEESCGKCTPCRIGNKRLYEILTKIVEGKGTMEDLDKLKELGNIIKDSALCGLGQSSPNPVLSTLNHFHDEYIAHVVHKKCPAGVCRSLISYHILENVCTGCGTCSMKCPVKCIDGEGKKPRSIIQESCIKCGTCFAVCKFGAIEKR